MGAAAARIARQLGGHVTILDIRPPADGSAFVQVDLRDRGSIDTAIRQLDEPVDVLLSCAGVAGPPFSALEVMQVNFLGARHLIESMVDDVLLPHGSVIGIISSIGGTGWEKNIESVCALLDTPDFESGCQWMAHNMSGEDEEALSHIAYGYSKQLLSAYVCLSTTAFANRGIRINAIGPGPTATPLMAATPTWQDFAAQDFQAKLGVEPSEPEQQAYPLLFLCSEAASFVSGQILNVDAGYVSRALSGEFESVLTRPLVSNRKPR